MGDYANDHILLWALAPTTTHGAAAGSEPNRALDDQAPALVSSDGVGPFFVTLFLSSPEGHPACLAGPAFVTDGHS